MRKFIIPFFIGLAGMFLNTSCLFYEEWFFPLMTFENNSNMTVRVVPSLEYPDTLPPAYQKYHYYIDWYAPHVKGEFDFITKREKVFKNYPVIQFFIYDVSEYNTLDETELRERELDQKLKLLHRYEVTRGWMEEHDWTITYP